MDSKRKPPTVLVAEDDDDDYLLLTDAFKKISMPHETCRVEDGEELLDFLLKRGEHAGRRDEGQPIIILLDLNMPRMDGREALRELKSIPHLSSIPTIVLTTSQAQEDIDLCYGLGACSYVKKPSGFADLVETAALLQRYWANFVELPTSGLVDRVR